MCSHHAGSDFHILGPVHLHVCPRRPTVSAIQALQTVPDTVFLHVSVTHDRGEGGANGNLSTLTLQSDPLDSCSEQQISFIQTFIPHYFTLLKGRPLKIKKGRPLILIFEGRPGTDVPFVPL